MSQMQPDLESYFRNFVPRRDPLLLELEREAQAEGIPIVGPVVGELLFILARVTAAANLLELGTATGYSAIHLARGCEPAGGRVLTLELDEAMAARARGNFARAGVSQRVEVRVGDALQLMAALERPLRLDLHGHRQGVLSPGPAPLPPPPEARRSAGHGQRRFHRRRGFQPGDLRLQDWRTVHLLSFLPNHSPEHDGLSLAVRE